MGELELGDSETSHLVVTGTQSMGNRMMWNFAGMLDDAGIDFQIVQNVPNMIVSKRNQKIIFLGFKLVEEYTRGRRFRTITFDIPENFIGLPANVVSYIQTLEEI
jgi:hypothetical protein